MRLFRCMITGNVVSVCVYRTGTAVFRRLMVGRGKFYSSIDRIMEAIPHDAKTKWQKEGEETEAEILPTCMPTHGMSGCSDFSLLRVVKISSSPSSFSSARILCRVSGPIELTELIRRAVDPDSSSDCVFVLDRPGGPTTLELGVDADWVVFVWAESFESDNCFGSDRKRNRFIDCLWSMDLAEGVRWSNMSARSGGNNEKFILERCYICTIKLLIWNVHETYKHKDGFTISEQCGGGCAFDCWS